MKTPKTKNHPTRRNNNMLIPTITMGAIAAVFVVVAYTRGHGEHVEGFSLAWKMTIGLLPLLVLALITAGMVQVVIPREAIARWLGEGSGLRGILIGSIAGGLTPGGPFVSLPVAAGLFRAGAGVGTMVAYVTGWSLWAVGRLPLEAGVLGPKFMVVRIVSTLIFPPLAGLLAHVLFSRWYQL
jgi:uncharacterized membrane protein YraQ (UPF0718 family)